MLAKLNFISEGHSYICTEMAKRGLITHEQAVCVHKIMRKCIWSRPKEIYMYLHYGPSLVKKLKKDLSDKDWKNLKKELYDDTLTIKAFDGHEKALDWYASNCIILWNRYFTPFQFKPINRADTVLHRVKLLASPKFYKVAYSIWKNR